jgi:TonB family protein
MYFSGAGIDKDEARAVALFRQACDAGNPAGCNNLGLAYFQGRGIAKDVKRAAELYQQACDKDGPFGCANLGVMYLRGEDIPRDDERAATLLRRACDRGHAGGCFNLGFVYATGRGVMQDESRAVTLYQRACDGGIGDACTRTAAMYEQGLGVAVDRARAAALYQRGRDLLGGGTAQQPQPLRVGGALKAPTKLKDVRPTYPVAAQYAGAQGAVVIEATIGPGGNVAQTKILRSIPLLDGAAEDAVKQWQYAPTIVDGKAVPVVMTVTVNFSLQDGAPK